MSPLLLAAVLGIVSLPQEPELPDGLDDETEPELPEGLGEAEVPEEEEEESVSFDLPLTFDGFADLRGGVRLLNDPTQDRVSLGELRLHFGLELLYPWIAVAASADVLWDRALNVHDVDLEVGTGAIDLREANILLTPLSFIDLRVGRQILTWGTGDLLFINDLFPKDWNAFIIGRDLAYLKAPSDAAKLSVYTPLVNLDVVWTPRFDSDRIPDKRRLSTFDRRTQTVTGADPPLTVRLPDRWFEDFELAARLFDTYGNVEVALYFYWGAWKSPGGFDVATGEAIHPPLSVYGASVRGPLLGGIYAAEVGYYDSREDRGRDDPFVDDSQLRGLLGYEHELATDLMLGLQYYGEWIIADRLRHLGTVRLTWMTFNQNVLWSLYATVSPSDVDLYLRPEVSYRIDDHWWVDVGGNVFWGKDRDTFFGQLQDNTNVWAAIRYGI